MWLVVKCYLLLPGTLNKIYSKYKEALCYLHLHWSTIRMGYMWGPCDLFILQGSVVSTLLTKHKGAAAVHWF